MRVSQVLRAPTRGGRLTIVNCAFWGAFVIWGLLGHPGASGWSEAPVRVAMLIFSAPIAVPAILPGIDGNPSGASGILVQCVLLGTNSLVWGYGLSFVLSKTTDRRHRNRLLAGLCRDCGYDLRATPERCPECGTAASGGGRRRGCGE